MRSKKWFAAAVATAALGVASTAQAAGSLVGQVGVQMVIGAGCTVINGSVSDGVNQWGTLDFGTHSNLTNVVDTQTVGSGGNVQIQCSTGLAPTLTVNGGLHAADGQRYMENAAASSTIAYSLYSDAARSEQIYPDTPVDIASVLTDEPVDLPLYARVEPGAQSTTTPAAGTYSDTLLVTLAW